MEETLVQYIEESKNWKALASSLGLSLAALTGIGRGSDVNAAPAKAPTITSNTAVAPISNSGYLKTAAEQIKKFEGFRDTVYNDTKGIPTIGYGVNLPALADDKGKALLAKYGLRHDLLLAGKQKMNEKLASLLLIQQIKKADISARKYLPNFDKYPDAVKIALVDMAFNMGLGGLSSFKKLKAELVRKNWQSAAKEIINSKNYGHSSAKGLRRRAATNSQNVAAIKQ